MLVGVAAHVVTFLKDAVDDVRMLLRMSAQHKESGMSTAVAEQIEDLRSQSAAGTVVISQGEDAVLDQFFSDAMHAILPPKPGRKIHCGTRQSDSGRQGRCHCLSHDRVFCMLGGRSRGVVPLPAFVSEAQTILGAALGDDGDQTIDRELGPSARVFE